MGYIHKQKQQVAALQNKPTRLNRAVYKLPSLAVLSPVSSLREHSPRLHCQN
jgi:hypothetical protein